MTDTTHLGLPLLEAAQAQKHVTVNEALSRLDALVNLSVLTRDQTFPPASTAEGDRHIVAEGGAGAWAGQDGQIAIFLNGGWSFAAPHAGLAAWVAQSSERALYDGASWRAGAVALAPLGAMSAQRLLTFDHVLAADSVSITAESIPDRAIVLAVTGRVITPISGALSWRLGVSGATDRYGNSVGIALNSSLIGVSGQPTAYYAATPLEIGAEGGSFTGGEIRFAIHYLSIEPPASV